MTEKRENYMRPKTIEFLIKSIIITGGIIIVCILCFATIASHKNSPAESKLYDIYAFGFSIISGLYILTMNSLDKIFYKK